MAKADTHKPAGGRKSIFIRSKQDKVDIGTHVLPKGYTIEVFRNDTIDKLISDDVVVVVDDFETAAKDIAAQTRKSEARDKKVAKERAAVQEARDAEAAKAADSATPEA